MTELMKLYCLVFDIFSEVQHLCDLNTETETAPVADVNQSLHIEILSLFNPHKAITFQPPKMFYV